MKKAQFLKKRPKKQKDVLNIDSFLINYSWINQKNTIFRSLPPEFIIEHALKIDYPTFDILRKWINAEKNNPMRGSQEEVNERKLREKLKKGIYTKQKKEEDSFRYLRDFSPTVEFKSDQYNRPLKLSRHMFLSKLRHDISSKFNEMFGSAIQITRGLYQISLNLDMALNELKYNIQGKELNKVYVISFLNLYAIKRNITPQDIKYGIIRGLMQDITFVELNGNRLRVGLNVFHLMTLLGWEDAFKFEGLCLYFEILINNLVIGIKSFIERLWRFTHNFSVKKNIPKEIKKEFTGLNKSNKWITPLETIYSILERIEKGYDFKEFILKDPTIKLNFDYNNGETLFLLNSLRNSYIHSSPKSISGVDKEELVIQKNSEIQSYDIYNLYISSPVLIKNKDNKDFSEFLKENGIITSNIDLSDLFTQKEILKYRIKWRAPRILNNMLDNISSPGIHENFPIESIVGIELPELKIFYPYPRKILKRETKPIKEIGDQRKQKISIFNLSDCLNSLFSFFKNLLKLYILNETEIGN